MTISMLPLDVIIDILSRLPVKTLLRFRCLSKFFRSIIDGSNFVNLHLKRSIETNSNLSIIFAGCTWPPDSRIYSGSLDSLDNCEELDHPFKNCRYIQSQDTLLIGSCNGLVALHNRKKGMVLFNPSTKKHRIIPKFYSDFGLCDTYFDGFGYDASADDFKLVRIIVFKRPLAKEVTVYSLKTNTWRRIEDFPFYFFMNSGNGAFAGGALHWVANQDPEAEVNDLILGFDLKTEEFFQAAIPPVGDGRFFLSVEVLRGCLSVVCKYDHAPSFDLWVMQEYGVKESWTKLFSFEMEYVPALAYSKSGDKILIKHYGKLSWYDLKQRVENFVEVDGIVQGYYDAIVCVGSLVSPNAYTIIDD